MRLLLVEDDCDVAETLIAYLRRQQFVIDWAPTLSIAREVLGEHDFDLVLLDRLLPDGDGVSLMASPEAVRRPQRFLLLSALSDTDDRIAGLELGARDYVAKPFEPRELLARIRNVLRQDLLVERDIKSFGPLAFDVEGLAFFVDDVALSLRRSEALVLAALMNRAGVLVRRETLEARVYGYDKFVNGNSLESIISRLRKALATRTDAVKVLAVRGVGYQLAMS